MNILTTNAHVNICPPLREFVPSSGKEIALGLILQGKKAHLITGSALHCVQAITKAARQSKDVILLKGEIRGEDFYLQEANLHVQTSKAASLKEIKSEVMLLRLKQLSEQALSLSASAQEDEQLKSLAISIEKKGETVYLRSPKSSVHLSVSAALKLADCLETMRHFQGALSFDPQKKELGFGRESFLLSFAQIGLLSRALHAQLLYPEYLEATAKAEKESTTSDINPSYFEQDHDEESLFY